MIAPACTLKSYVVKRYLLWWSQHHKSKNSSFLLAGEVILQECKSYVRLVYAIDEDGTI